MMSRCAKGKTEAFDILSSLLILFVHSRGTPREVGVLFSVEASGA